MYEFEISIFEIDKFTHTFDPPLFNQNSYSLALCTNQLKNRTNFLPSNVKVFWITRSHTLVAHFHRQKERIFWTFESYQKKRVERTQNILCSPSIHLHMWTIFGQQRNHYTFSATDFLMTECQIAFNLTQPKLLIKLINRIMIMRSTCLKR